MLVDVKSFLVGMLANDVAEVAHAVSRPYSYLTATKQLSLLTVRVMQHRRCSWLADSLKHMMHLGCAQEEFLSAYGEQVAVAARQEAIQVELEACGEDMEKMAALLDELQARCHLVERHLCLLPYHVS